MQCPRRNGGSKMAHDRPRAALLPLCVHASAHSHGDRAHPGGHAGARDDGGGGEVDDGGQEPLQNAEGQADDVQGERQTEPGRHLPPEADERDGHADGLERQRRRVGRDVLLFDEVVPRGVCQELGAAQAALREVAGMWGQGLEWRAGGRFSGLGVGRMEARGGWWW